MTHYVGVFVHATTGRWRALVPDLPSYEIEEGTLDTAIIRAEEFLRRTARLGTPIPSPRPLALIKLDEEWASTRGIDWSRSVVTMIQVRE
ncbi:MAG TPA: hypothetical protein VFO36_02985 [Nitrospiraceae bacterium]|jgi:hypothetical protein|nr:hypothetical protein [Nitrospiraceae bacterium]